MSTLPTDLSTQRNESQMKADLDAFLDSVSEMPGGAAPTELTISTGAITPTGCFHTIDTEGDASTDDLTTASVTNHPQGRFLLLMAVNAARTVVVKHNAGGSGQFSLAGAVDLSLDETTKSVLFVLKGTVWQEVARSGGTPSPVSIFVEEQSSGSDGGTATTGSWQTRAFNTARVNGAAVDLTSNQFTPPAGTYLVEWSAPAFRVNVHQTRLRNVTDSSTEAMGTSERAAEPSYTQSRSVGSCQLVANGTDAFEIQHRVGATHSTEGYGKAAGFSENEVYSTVKFTRIS